MPLGPILLSVWSCRGAGSEALDARDEQDRNLLQVRPKVCLPAGNTHREGIPLILNTSLDRQKMRDTGNKVGGGCFP